MRASLNHVNMSMISYHSLFEPDWMCYERNCQSVANKESSNSITYETYLFHLFHSSVAMMLFNQSLVHSYIIKRNYKISCSVLISHRRQESRKVVMNNYFTHAKIPSNTHVVHAWMSIMHRKQCQYHNEQAQIVWDQITKQNFSFVNICTCKRILCPAVAKSCDTWNIADASKAWW